MSRSLALSIAAAVIVVAVLALAVLASVDDVRTGAPLIGTEMEV